MSFCSNCGAEIKQENQAFCSNCGAKIGEATAAYTNSNPVYSQPVNQPVATPFPMKWYKFLIYFLLFAGAVVNIAFGFNYITGDIYTVQSDTKVTGEMVYAVFGSGLKTVDVLYGVFGILIAVFGFYTRSRLAKYKANGPTCLYVLYIISAVAGLLYLIAVKSIVGTDLDIPSTTIVSAVTSFVMVLLNVIYFNKRKSLFTN